ncbi:MAG TPA: histidine kinase [Gaiellaceae bacterium]|nr:histidine kinase [Gaiellaceae bacterium]
MRTTPFGLPRLDVAIAVALLAVKLAGMATGVQTGGGAVSWALAPLWTLPLAWRSRSPLAVALVVAAANAVEVGLAGVHDSIVFLAVFLLIPYSLAAHGRGTARIAAGLCALVASGGVSQAAQPSPGSARAWATTVAGDLALVVVPFLVGLALRQQRLRAEALEQLAVQLEREREERARAAVAEERTRIARELHDELAHAMSVIAVQADAAEGALERDPALVQRPLLAIRSTARDALADMRRVLGGLRSGEQAQLAPEPGLARLGGLLEQTRAAGIEVELRVEGEPAPLPPSLDLAAYRVVQEGLTNVRKHADARRVEVLLRYGRDAVAVEVADDGAGAGAGAGGGSGRGLAGIRERVALLGGEFVAGPRARGFALRVTLPLA